MSLLKAVDSSLQDFCIKVLYWQTELALKYTKIITAWKTDSKKKVYK